MLAALTLKLTLITISLSRCPFNCTSGCISTSQSAGYTCSSCSPSFYLSHPSPSTSTCLPCPPDCLTCISPTNCLTCSHYFAEQQQSPSSNNSCLACSPLCRTCHPTPSHCTSCYPPYRHNPNTMTCSLLPGLSPHCIAPIIYSTYDYSLQTTPSPSTIYYCYNSYSEYYVWMNHIYRCPGAILQCMLDVPLFFEELVFNNLWYQIDGLDDVEGSARMGYWHKETWLELALLVRRAGASRDRVDACAKMSRLVVQGEGGWVFNLTARMGSRAGVYGCLGGLGASEEAVTGVVLEEIQKILTVIECMQGYYLPINSTHAQCHNCPPRCKLCNQYRQCSVCYPGYYLTNGICGPCHRTCSECNGPAEGQCRSCGQGMRLRSGRCVRCPSMCESCLGRRCIECIRPFSRYADTLGMCYRCLQQQCYDCLSTDPSLCMQCLPGHALLAGSCLACTPNCHHCTATPTAGPTCLSCLPGYTLHIYLCTLCPQNCHTCSSIDPSICLHCNQLFLININTNKCQYCWPGCLECVDVGESGCVLWGQGYGVIEQGFGRCRGQGCHRCGGYGCVECLRGYYLEGGLCWRCGALCGECESGGCLQCEASAVPGTGDNSSLCLPCAPHCLSCSPTNPSLCLSCPAGTLASAPNCRPCPQNCLSCTSPSQCISCNWGYSLNTNNTCTKCVTHCYGTCNSQNVNICYSCHPGFVMRQGRCVRCALGCVKCQQGYCRECARGLRLEVKEEGGQLSIGCVEECVFPCWECDGQRCLGCARGWVLGEDGQCQVELGCEGEGCECPQSSVYRVAIGTPDSYRCEPCPDGCRSCQGLGSGVGYRTSCLKCLPGYYISNSTCLPCPHPCKLCHSASQCDLCSPGYTNPSHSLQCTPCSPGCLTCHTRPQTCITCLPQYQLINQRCISMYRVQFKLVFVDELKQFMHANKLVNVLVLLAETADVDERDIILYSVLNSSTFVRGAIAAGSKASASAMTSTLIAILQQSPSFFGSTLLSVSTFALTFRNVLLQVFNAMTYNYQPGETQQKPQRLITGWMIALFVVLPVGVLGLAVVFRVGQGLLTAVAAAVAGVLAGRGGHGVPAGARAGLEVSLNQLKQ